jgi:hypothetical protein
MAVLLADEEVPSSVERHAGGAAREGHGCGGQAVGRRLGAPAGDRLDDVVAVHGAHAVVRAVSDQDVLLPVEKDLGGKVEEGLGGRPAVAAVVARHQSVVHGGM